MNNDKQRYAQLSDGIIVNIITGNPEGRFSPSIKWHKVDDNAVIGDYYISSAKDVKDTDSVASLKTVKSQILNVLHSTFRFKMDYLNEDYTSDEIETFPIQWLEATLYLTDENTKTPLLTAIAGERNMSVKALAKKVIVKHDQYHSVAGIYIGRYKRLKERIENAVTVEQLNKVKQAIQTWREQEGIKL